MLRRVAAASSGRGALGHRPPAEGARSLPRACTLPSGPWVPLPRYQSLTPSVFWNTTSSARRGSTAIRNVELCTM